jgi:hypothetical protein
MKRAAGVFTALFVAVSLTSGTLSSASTISRAKLSSELISINQMPKGTRIAVSSHANGAGCLKNLLAPKGVKQTRLVEIAFSGSFPLPVLDEKLATYSNAVRRCPRFAGLSASGREVTGTIVPMSFAHYGNASSAYAMKFTEEGVKFQCEYVIARKGGVVMSILEADTAAVNTSQFKGFVVMALKKIP